MFVIDDALLMTGGSALLGGLTDWLGGDPEQKKIDEIKALIDKRKNEINTDYTKKKRDLMTVNQTQKSGKLRGASQRAAEMGVVSPGGLNYNAVEGLDESLYGSLDDLDAAKNRELAQLDDVYMQSVLGTNTSSGLERFGQGAFTGASVGSSVANMLTQIGGDDKGNKSGGTGIGDKTKTTKKDTQKKKTYFMDDILDMNDSDEEPGFRFKFGY